MSISDDVDALGYSIAICTHNRARLLGACLEYLVVSLGGRPVPMV